MSIAILFQSTDCKFDLMPCIYVYGLIQHDESGVAGERTLYEKSARLEGFGADDQGSRELAWP